MNANLPNELADFLQELLDTGELAILKARAPVLNKETSLIVGENDTVSILGIINGFLRKNNYDTLVTQVNDVKTNKILKYSTMPISLLEFMDR